MGDYFESEENLSSLQTGKGVRSSHRPCKRSRKGRKAHYQSSDQPSKSREFRDPSPDGDAPIFPLNPKDPEPECHPPEYNQTSPSKCKDHILLYLVAGYILGILVVLIWYYWNPQRARCDLGGTWFLIVVFFLLLLILTQIRSARCIALLCLPTLAHYQSRAVFVALAFLIAFSGPVQNIICNIGIMADSLNCQQNQLIDALGSMNRITSNPLQLVEELFKKTFDEVLGIREKLDELLVKLENPIAHIYGAYELCGSWLALQNDNFDFRMGTPYTRCLRAGTLSISQYQTEIGEQARQGCNQELFAWFCESLKGEKGFFHNNLQLPEIITGDIYQRLRICIFRIRMIFLATISFDYSEKPNTRLFSTDRDHIYNPEATRNKLNYISFWLHLIVFILLLTVILQSIEFRFRYLMSERFENVYITKEFEVYDEHQSQIVGDRVLPLSTCEDNKYIKITSLELLPGECKAMYRSGVFLLITGIQLYCLCLVDYSLYSMLALMLQHGNMTADIQPSPYRKMVIKGGGQIGNFLQDFVHAFEPNVFKMDSCNCLPNPEKPKYSRYFWISMFYLLAWIMVFWEPYGLRQRHRIMAYFHPEESYRRVQYLHYKILKERKSIPKLSLQKARFLKCYTYENKMVSCISHLSSLTSWFFSGCRSDFIGRSCTMCRKPLTTSDHVFCDLPNCSGVYCNKCFNKSNNICILCCSQSECALSEIGDSSEDWEYSYCSPDNFQSQ